MPMKSPSHPGRLIKSACLEPLGLSVSEAARVLGVSRPALSSLINGQAALSAEMAIRLEKAFGSTADAWVRLPASVILLTSPNRVYSQTTGYYVKAQEGRPRRHATARISDGSRLATSGR